MHVQDFASKQYYTEQNDVYACVIHCIALTGPHISVRSCCIQFPKTPGYALSDSIPKLSLFVQPNGREMVTHRGIPSGMAATARVTDTRII